MGWIPQKVNIYTRFPACLLAYLYLFSIFISIILLLIVLIYCLVAALRAKLLMLGRKEDLAAQRLAVIQKQRDKPPVGAAIDAGAGSPTSVAVASSEVPLTASVSKATPTASPDSTAQASSSVPVTTSSSNADNNGTETLAPVL